MGGSDPFEVFKSSHYKNLFANPVVFPIQNLHTLCDKNKTAVEAEFAEFTLILSPFKCHNCQAISHTLKLAL